MNIERIESLTYTEAAGMALEKLNIKGHDCFICDLGGNFGYSILVFKNGKHIYYANDYCIFIFNIISSYFWFDKF